MINNLAEENTKSSYNTIQNILYSIAKIDKGQDVILKKIEYLEKTIELAALPKQIIKDIKTSIELGNDINAEYLYSKYAFFFTAVPKQEITLDNLDYAILDLQYEQESNNLKKELLGLASISQEGTIQDLRDKLLDLTNRSKLLSEPLEAVPENALKEKDDAYKELIENNGKLSLVIPEVEKCAGKAGEGHLVSILAFVGSYKSTFSLNIAYENAMKGYNILYLSLESTEKEMVNRLVLNHIASTSKKRDNLISQTDVRDKKLTPEQIKLYNKKHNELSKLLENNLILWDSIKAKYKTFGEMSTTLRKADKEFLSRTGKGIDAIIIDQLALLKYTEGAGGNKKYGYDGAVMNDWMTYFREQTLNFLDTGRQITTFVVSQVRRDAYAEASKKNKKGRYTADCGGDSNEIERTSDTIITLYKDLEQKNTLLVYVPKARHGYTPDEVIQTEVYGNYFHVGSFENLDNTSITMDDLSKEEFNLKDLLKG